MRILFAAAVLGLLASAAGAATQTTTFAVNATVVSSCAVSAADLTFPDYDPLALLPTDGNTAVTVTCSLAAPFNVGLDAGTVGSGVGARQMLISGGGTDKLNYSLYRDLARTLNWGMTVGTDTLASLGTGLAVAIPVYGRIAAGQNKTIGTYTDTITVTVTY